MGDIGGVLALDVAIGLILMFALLALIASGISEAVARALAWRAKDLEEGIANLLQDPARKGLARQVLSHPLIRGLERHGAGTDPKDAQPPSYIPASVFATALLDTLADSDEPLGQRATVLEARERIGTRHVDANLATALAPLLGDPQEGIANAHKAVEQWYDAAMERVSGWYKRRTQVALLVIGIGLAGAFNADAFQVANTLWTSDTTRAAVVAEAERLSEARQGGGGEGRLENVAKDVQQLESLKLPIGWELDDKDVEDGVEASPRRPPDGWAAWGSKLLGLLVTGFAVSLGAPFWFDSLGRALALRSSGRPPASGAERG
jgi:hypothetical protein